MRECDTVIAAFKEAVWDPKKEDVRLDDGTSDIDTLDAVEYSFEEDINRLMDVRYIDEKESEENNAQ
jgi:hypothetical protein